MKKVRAIIIAFVLLMIVLYGTNAYINDFYVALDTAVAASESNDKITVTQYNDAYIFAPTDEASIVGGFIFYPGGKVEDRAYAPLMQEMAENGYVCVLPHLNLNLAFLEINAANHGYKELYPSITHWYIGGHSLGGVGASTYLAKHVDDFDGLVLLASYTTKDLSDTNLKVVSIYGTEDLVLRKDQYEKAKEHLPSNAVEYIIDGGNHAYFGTYGAQKGDGEALISNEEQIATCVDYITNTFAH